PDTPLDPGMDELLGSILGGGSPAAGDSDPDSVASLLAGLGVLEGETPTPVEPPSSLLPSTLQESSPATQSTFLSSLEASLRHPGPKPRGRSAHVVDETEETDATTERLSSMTSARPTRRRR
ncbi:hypothetical protein KIPB_003065, partial [Kipferlia bialata]